MNHRNAFVPLALRDILLLAAIVGDPDRCIEIAKPTEAAGCQPLCRLLDPYEMTHKHVMSPIELLGKQLIPEFHRHQALTPKPDQAPSRCGS